MCQMTILLCNETDNPVPGTHEITFLVTVVK